MKFALSCVLALILCSLHATANRNLNFSAVPPADSNMSQSQFIHDAVQDIMRVTGLHANFELKTSHVRNIEAIISHRKRYIVYNPDFIEKVNIATAEKWGTIALLAHEIGHHLNGHTLKKGGSKPTVELEADEFAGFVLYRLGATLQQSQEVMYHIAGRNASTTHPGRLDRLEAIKKGWLRAKGGL
jgi:hypothetical protein